MAKFNRNIEGFIPSHVLLDAAIRNPDMTTLTKTLYRTQQLWAGSDARNGQLFRFLQSAGKGDRFIYDAKNGTSRPGTLTRKEGDGPVSDAIVNDGYDFHGIVRDYYLKVHGRNSIDANGMAIKGIVHYDQDYDNAYWDGQYMTYGDGDHTLFLTFMLLNVAAHELGHGVTEYAVPGGIEYYGMAGAINEHLSDVSGANVESWHDKVSAKAYHWLVGKGIWAPSSNPKAVRRALRDMLNPGTAYNDPRLGKDRQPGHMKDYVKTGGDNGGVHTNSGIPNHLYALFANGIEDAGLGNDWDSTVGKAAKIWYAARPNLGNNPSFGQLAYWALEACAVISEEEAQLRGILQKAIDAIGLKADKKATDNLTPERGSDDE